MRRPRSPSAACACALGLALLAAGCGNDVTKPTTPTFVKPKGTVPVDHRPLGVTLRVPGNWDLQGGKAPLLTKVTSGPVTVTVWRYERRKYERIPSKKIELVGARLELISAVRERDPKIVIRSSKVVEINGVKGIELVAVETVGTAKRKVRSTHLYGNGLEVVVDAMAPPSQFRKVDREAFIPLTRSVHLIKVPKPKPAASAPGSGTRTTPGA